MQTFENQSKTQELITVTGLVAMVLKLGLDKKRAVKQLREEMIGLAKSINLQKGNVSMAPARMMELEYEGFVEFLLQIAHRNFNSINATQG